MANKPSLDALLDRINVYFGKVNLKLTEKVPVVAHAVNTLKIGTSTLAQMVATAVGYSSVHIANKSNPHKVTPEQAGSYSVADFNVRAAQQISSGIVPISRYGTLSYLPAGVSGSFGGASTVKSTAAGGYNNDEHYSLQLEDNGTLAFLRNGTDGSTINVYYGYVENAVNALNLNAKVIMTTKRYEPPFLPSGQSVAFLMQGGQAALAGRFQDAAGVQKDCFIALTNGTLDPTAHVAGLFTPVWADIIERSEVVRGKDTIYLIYNHFAEPAAIGGNQPLDLQVYSFPISAMDGVSYITPTKVTIGECTGFLGAKYTTGEIRMAARAESSDVTAPALIHHVNGFLNGSGGATGPTGFWNGNRHTWANGRVLTLSAFNADFSKLRIMTYQDPRYAGLVSTKIAWSCVLDMNTLKCTLDEGLTPMQVVVDPNDPLKLIASGTVQSRQNGIIISNYVAVDMTSRCYITDNGLIFASRIPYAPTGTDSLYRGKWNNFTNVFDAIKCPLYERPTDQTSAVNCPFTFGSLAGDGFDGFRLLPGNVGVVMCRNNISNTAVMKFKILPTGQPLVPNYDYASTTYPEGLKGFKPRVERDNVPQPIPRTLLMGIIQEMSDTGLKGTHGSVLCNYDNLNSRYISIDENLVTSGAISATDANLNTLRDAILVAGGVALTDLISTSLIDLVIPQNPAVPAFATVFCATAAFQRWTIVARVNVDARSGVVSVMSVHSIVGQYKQTVAGNNLEIGTTGTGQFRCGTYCIYELDNEFMVTCVPTPEFRNSGGSVYHMSRFIVNKSDGSITNFTAAAGSAGIVGARWGGLPGYGVGAFQTNDYTSKLIYKQMAKTKAQFIAGVYRPDNEAIVLLSQQVAQGWALYFTEETPIILNGVPGTLPVTSIDLSTVKANPANTTFYVYVIMTAGVPSYAVYTQFMTETNTMLFIGTVQTSDSTISLINVNKVTKFAGFRLSTLPAGNSMPVTPGLPSKESHLDAGWLP